MMFYFCATFKVRSGYVELVCKRILRKSRSFVGEKINLFLFLKNFKKFFNSNSTKKLLKRFSRFFESFQDIFFVVVNSTIELWSLPELNRKASSKRERNSKNFSKSLKSSQYFLKVLSDFRKVLSISLHFSTCVF